MHARARVRRHGLRGGAFLVAREVAEVPGTSLCTCTRRQRSQPAQNVMLLTVREHSTLTNNNMKPGMQTHLVYLLLVCVLAYDLYLTVQLAEKLRYIFPWQAYEPRFYFAKERTLSYSETEQKQRQRRGIMLKHGTPDFLLKALTIINGCNVNWIECKTYFGSPTMITIESRTKHKIPMQYFSQ